jgi:hypothetical protein
LAPFLLGCSEAEDHYKEHKVEQNCSPHGSWEAERERERQREIERVRKRKGSETKNLLQGYTPMTYFLQLDPISYSFHSFPTAHSAVNP